MAKHKSKYGPGETAVGDLDTNPASGHPAPIDPNLTGAFVTLPVDADNPGAPARVTDVAVAQAHEATYIPPVEVEKHKRVPKATPKNKVPTDKEAARVRADAAKQVLAPKAK